MKTAMQLLALTSALAVEPRPYRESRPKWMQTEAERAGIEARRQERKIKKDERRAERQRKAAGRKQRR